VPDPSDLCLKVHPESLTARLRRVDRHNNYTNFSNIVKFTLVTKVFYSYFQPPESPSLGGHPQTPGIRHRRTALLLVTDGDILLPFGVFVEAVIHYVVADYGRRRGLAAQFHACYFGGTPCLALIAGPACAYHVIPGMFASQAARDNVVYGEVSGLLTAILAGIIVSNKHLTPAQLPLYAGTFDHVNQADHRGQIDSHRGAADCTRVFLQHLCLAPPEQDNGPPGTADIERLVVLIKNKDRGIYHNILRLSQILTGSVA
jgi:hypothetical protein